MTKEKKERDPYVVRLEAFCLGTVFYLAVLMVLVYFVDLSPVVVVPFLIYWVLWGRRLLNEVKPKK